MGATANYLNLHARGLSEEVERGEKSQIFGIWKENDAIEDVHKYVRDLRRSRCTRYQDSIGNN